MPKIEIKKVYQEIKLSDYAPEYEGQTIRVHINPSRSALQKMNELRDLVDEGLLNEESVREFVELISSLWDEWSDDNVRDLFNEAYDTDPRFFEWLVYKTMLLIYNHRALVKKN
jgi:hypothetical protein